MAEVRWSGPALEDLRLIIEYICQDSPAYAARVGGDLVRVTDRLAPYPLSGRIVPEFDDPNIRELICGTYRVIYLVRSDTCFVVAVVHGSRDLLRHLTPGAWDVD